MQNSYSPSEAGRSSGAKMNRRDFIYTLGASGAALAAFPQTLTAAPGAPAIKSISGSWFEFQHHATVEGVDWNPECVRFTSQQWDAKVKEIADVGMEYLVLMATALYYRAFFRTDIFPSWQLACPDPMEAVLSAADKYGVKFFIGGGFYGDWAGANIISDPIAAKKRLQAIEQITKLYGHHKSFYGWYWPNEAFINRHYSEEFIRYVNACSQLARRLTPRARILIAPYGTRVAVPDDEYVRQLEALDVDFIAYQDEVGVRKSTVKETPAFFEGLKKAHDRAQRAAIWADVEIFQFESGTYKSALLPAPFERVRRQLAAVSPYVDKILVYQYQGMMNKPGSAAFCGTPASTKLYTAYTNWLKARGRAQ
jgi:Domain of unknown function (DUF4434)